MNSQDKYGRDFRHPPSVGFESSYDEGYFPGNPASGWEGRLAALEAESPFQKAFEQSASFTHHTGSVPKSDPETPYDHAFADEFFEPDDEEPGALDLTDPEAEAQDRFRYLPHEERFDPSAIPQDVAEALKNKEWEPALKLAIQAGWRDGNALTNLIFFSRHSELPVGRLDPKNPKFKQLSAEWNKILNREVTAAIYIASKDTQLKVSGSYVAERDPQFWGEAGKKFKEIVQWAAQEADINPGFLSAVLLAELDHRSFYLNPNEVLSFDSGTDDFYAARHQLRKYVPAFSKVRFDEKRITTDVNEHGRKVTTIPFKSGKDAALATAVYLKYAEIKLRNGARENGGDFDALPVETRFVLVRIAMAAGHGGITPDGQLIRFKKKGGKWVQVQKGEKGGVLVGVALRLERVLRKEDILIRDYSPRRDPTHDGRATHRNATILAAQAIHLSDWVFGIPLNVAATQPEFEADKRFDTQDFDETEFEHDTETDFDGEFSELTDELELIEAGMEAREDPDALEARELDPVLLDIAEKIISRELPATEYETPKTWTRCFSGPDIAKVKKVYEDNIVAANTKSNDRCSCIVMLNVALGQLLPLRLKQHPARSESNRSVQMANLSTESIEASLRQLQRKGFATPPAVMNFYDRRGRTAGTLKPERLKLSVQNKIMAYAKTKGCWFAFGMSVMDGYHSVLLIVDHTADDAKIYWLDQFSTGLDDDVSTTLDHRLTEMTQRWWQAVMDEKKKGYNTMIRLWPLRKLR